MDVAPQGKEWTNKENLEEAAKLKQQGNKHFVAKQFKEALRAYHKAFLHLGGIIGEGSPMSMYSKNTANTQLTQQANQLKFAISLNMAQIYIFQSKYERGLEILTKASKIKTNAKLYYRRGICYMRLSQFQKAREDLSKVAEFDMTMKVEVEKLLEQLKNLQRKQDQKSKDMFKKFFK